MPTENKVNNNVNVPKLITGVARPNDLVVTRNDFPLASYNIDLNLEKLMYCAMVIVRKTELETDHIFNPNDLITVTAQNFGELTNLDKDKTSKEIEIYANQALKRIYKKFDVENPTMLVRLHDDPNPIKVPMMTRCHYSTKNKSIEIRFAAEFYDYFYNLIKWDKKNSSFTSYALKQVVRLDSKYGVRLYGFLISLIWRTNEVKVDLADLRWRFQCVNRYTELFNFKKRVLDAACKDLNENTNLQVTYENVLDGRDVTGIKFMFSYKNEKDVTNSIKESSKKNEGVLLAYKPLTDKQINFLVSCDEFLNDYGFFIGNNNYEDSRRIMRDLLKNSLEQVCSYKSIDLDYYFNLKAEKQIN